MKTFEQAHADLPLIAILRGIRPAEAIEIAISLVDAGFRMIEVPLNSPNPFQTIALLADRFGKTGAGDKSWR